MASGRTRSSSLPTGQVSIGDIRRTAGHPQGSGATGSEPLVAPLLYLIFGNVVASTLQAEFGWSYDTWWVVAAVAAALLVFVFGWFGVRLSTGAGTILGLFEILVFAALAVTLIVQAGDANTGTVFGTEFATVEGFGGLSGVIAGSVYTILAFIGFEAAAPLAEEARDPRRTVRLAVIYSCLLIGLFYVLTTYAAAVFFGPDRFAEFPTAGGNNPWDFLAREAWGAGWVLVFLAVANSAIANANASATPPPGPGSRWGVSGCCQGCWSTSTHAGARPTSPWCCSWWSASAWPSGWACSTSR